MEAVRPEPTGGRGTLAGGAPPLGLAAPSVGTGEPPLPMFAYGRLMVATLRVFLGAVEWTAPALTPWMEAGRTGQEAVEPLARRTLPRWSLVLLDTESPIAAWRGLCRQSTRD